MKTKSALSWFGSDASVAADLASLLDGCNHVTVPFVGGASIIPHLKARAIVANDLNNLAINFYRVLSGSEGSDAMFELTHKCSETLSHPDELHRALRIVDAANEGMPITGSVSRASFAWAYWVICWLGRKGKGGTDDGVKLPSVRWSANGGTNATRIRAVSSDLAAWSEHFQRCEWQCCDFREIAAKLKDDPKCGSYWDAPWPTAGDRYIHKFTEQDHRDMAEAVHRFSEHRIVIRYGDDPLIRDLYSDDRWTITEIRSRNQANNEVSENWITNFDPSGDTVSPLEH